MVKINYEPLLPYRPPYAKATEDRQSGPKKPARQSTPSNNSCKRGMVYNKKSASQDFRFSDPLDKSEIGNKKKAQSVLTPAEIRMIKYGTKKKDHQ